jgi:Tfp pilus assembly protein PilP
MQLVKFKNGVTIWVLACCLGALLSACDGGLSAQGGSSSDASLPIVDNPRDAQLWLEKQAQHAQNIDNPSRPSQVTDHRLLRTASPISNKVFISLNNTAAENVKSRNTEAGQNDPASSSLVADGWGVGNHLASIQAETKAQTELELAQANASQIKFLGVIQNQHELFGLVQVGERVYRVKQHEPIGAGKWRVVSIDEARMQLNVNGKVVTYDK